MNNIQRLASLADEAYQGIFGVTEVTFDRMLSILEEACKQRHTRGGRPISRLSVLDKLIITPGYYREYRTVRHTAFDYEVIHKNIQWVEDVPVSSGKSALPSGRSLTETKGERVVLPDVTEYETGSPEKSRKNIIPARRKGIH